MKKINWNFILFSCMICLLPICIGLYFYDELPNTMAIHFNIENQPDNYASKDITLFGLPVIMAILQASCCIVSDCNEIKKEKSPKIVRYMKWFIPSLTIIAYVLTVLVGLGKNVDIGKIVSIVLGLMFMFMGNYMPKMTYEDAKGNINPLPANENDFKSMIRLWGYSFVIGGMAIIVAIFISNKAAFITMLGLCLLVFAESTYFSFKRN